MKNLVKYNISELRIQKSTEKTRILGNSCEKDIVNCDVMRINKVTWLPGATMGRTKIVRGHLIQPSALVPYN